MFIESNTMNLKVNLFRYLSRKLRKAIFLFEIFQVIVLVIC